MLVLEYTAAAITIIIMLALFIAITPSALMGLAGFVIIGSILFKRLTGPLASRLDREMTDSQRDFTQAYFEAVNNKSKSAKIKSLKWKNCLFLKKILSLKLI